MSEHEKVRKHDDMPAVHKPVAAAAKSGRDDAAKTAAVDRAELQRLTARLQSAHDPHERTAILAAIEHRFGGAAADRVVAELGRHGAAGGSTHPHRPGGHE